MIIIIGIDGFYIGKIGGLKMELLLKDSRTRDNLMRAFAGESQARNRYIFGGEAARKKNLYIIQSVFEYTANQEVAHAKVYYDLLKEFSGNNISVDGNYPVNIDSSIVNLLRAAEHNEYQEYEHEYFNFGKIAREEGFEKVAATFEIIAKIEKTHGDRFRNFADLLEEGRLFKLNEEVEWICLNCGHIHTGKTAPNICPVCSHNQGYFKEKINLFF